MDIFIVLQEKIAEHYIKENCMFVVEHLLGRILPFVVTSTKRIFVSLQTYFNNSGSCWYANGSPPIISTLIISSYSSDKVCHIESGIQVPINQ